MRYPCFLTHASEVVSAPTSFVLRGGGGVRKHSTYAKDSNKHCQWILKENEGQYFEYFMITFSWVVGFRSKEDGARPKLWSGVGSRAITRHVGCFHTLGIAESSKLVLVVTLKWELKFKFKCWYFSKPPIANIQQPGLSKASDYPEVVSVRFAPIRLSCCSV